SKKRVEAWWAELLKKGERQVLIEGTVKGDWDSMASGRLLRQKYPDAALDALPKGIAAASDEWVKTDLTRSLAELKSPAAVAALRAQLKAPTLRGRVAAASELSALGHADGV